MPRNAEAGARRRPRTLRAIRLATLMVIATAMLSGGVSAAQARIARTATTTSATGTAGVVSTLKEISYYPAQNPWGGMWTSWDPGVISDDMAKIAALGANTVRIFVQPATFGYPIPQSIYMSRLAQLVSLASANGLKVHLTLFDLWSDYSDRSGSEQWAAQVLAPFRRDTRIAAVELQNEIDPTNPQAMAWARTMLPVIRSDSGRPVTLSVSGWNSADHLSQLIAALGSVHPDFYDLHFYGTPSYINPTLSSAKQIAGGAPLLIGETGYSTDPSNTTWLGPGQTVDTEEQAQSYFLSWVEQAARQLGLPPAGVWNLNDFPPLPYVGPIEQHYGLYRLDGTAKPAVATLKTAFGWW